MTTDHALANRVIDPQADAVALASFAPAAQAVAAPELVLGHQPLWQPLLPAEGGRWQPHELAFDPVKQDWFNVFGAENRQPGEWGHWTGRGMNWNSMCAQCHMTGYQKNYDAAADTYRSTWVEHGVGCIQCHGPTAVGHGRKEAPRNSSAGPFHGDRQKIMQTCATCHARAEQLSLEFQPGDDFNDHFRVALPVDAAVFYPDGQQRDEDFNWTSMLLSRMNHAGVTCLDCHDPHTTKVILPVTNNQLCLQCHGAPGRVQPNGTRATPIDPLAHSHHAEGSAGNHCVSCHMPTTSYMQRAPRHDHGWLKPDPLLTKELGIPNACSRCHVDKDIDWAIARADGWYGRKLESRQRDRARAIAGAQAGTPAAADAVLALLASEDIPAWRATYLSLLGPFLSSHAAAVEAGRKGLKAADPLERAAAVRLLTGHPEFHGSDGLAPLLNDPVRLVRLDAAWALSDTLNADSPERRDYDRYLAISLDQPSGRLRLGQDLANRGQLVPAEKEMALASTWDPQSADIHRAHGMVLNALGRTDEAATKFGRVAALEPQDAPAALYSALAYAAAGRLSEAEVALRNAVQRDPGLDRAWYNLGLLLAKSGKNAEAAEVLGKAEAIAPGIADYPYALATLLIRTGDRTGSAEAAQRALVAQPDHRGALQILRATENR